MVSRLLAARIKSLLAWAQSLAVLCLNFKYVKERGEP